MPELALTAGTIEYEDTGGSGPVVVPIHGLVMTGSLWRNVVEDLRRDHRCVVPTLPLGAHRFPMRADADLSLRGIAKLVDEFIERLGLHDVTLVSCDSGVPLVAAAAYPQRIGRLVITSCEAFDNLPPGLPGHFAAFAALLPGGILLASLSLAVPLVRRSPLTFGWMSKRPVPSDVFSRWIEPARRQSAVRRDLRKYARDPHSRRDLLAATEALRAFQRPALVVWATEDRVMPRDHARRLAALLPDAELVYIDDTYTLIPEDQPVQLARLIRGFVERREKTRASRS
jgi:pimeloyl-ACP methyl ester carboxylesterase